MSDTRDNLLTALVHRYSFALEVPFRGVSGKRRFRWDAAREDVKLAVEYQGIGKGHQWHAEQAKDHDKLNEAQLCGWVVIQCSAVTVNDGRCLRWIEAALASVA